MSETSPTTRLEAVNLMLRTIGEGPISSLVDAEGIDVPIATETLDTILRSVMAEGWQFNTEHDYPLTRDVEGKIGLPPNVLDCRFIRGRNGNTDPVRRGNRIYDRENHTYTFDRDLKAEIIFGLPFEELPESGRYYVAVRAARRFHDTQLGSDTLHQFSSADEYRARAEFYEQHTEHQDLNMLRDTPDFARLFRL